MILTYIAPYVFADQERSPRHPRNALNGSVDRFGFSIGERLANTESVSGDEWETRMSRHVTPSATDHHADEMAIVLILTEEAIPWRRTLESHPIWRRTV